MKKIADILNAQPYPGRGIVMGRTPDGEKAVLAYFIMGRSTNSRNRVFTQSGKHGWDIRTEAFDESLVTDPSLIIYTPVKVTGNSIIVTNGSQTDAISNLLNNQVTFQQALQFIKFEPDLPYYTPRISAIINFCKMGGFDYSMSIVKTADGNPASCRRFLYSYASPLAGQGHLIHTYRAPNEDEGADAAKMLPSFCGEPATIEIGNDIDEFTDMIWNSLDEDNKVSLFTRYIDVTGGDYESRIINKNKM
jgi:IMP cyclohydrolase